MAPRKVCAVARCPEKTHARLATPQGTHRKDLCIVHAVLTKRRYKSNVIVVEEWGENKVFDEHGELIFDKLHFETKEEATAKEVVQQALESA